jgi:hypothetical protein
LALWAPQKKARFGANLDWSNLKVATLSSSRCSSLRSRVCYLLSLCYRTVCSMPRSNYTPHSVLRFATLIARRYAPILLRSSLRSIAAHIHYVHICSFTIRCAHCSLCSTLTMFALLFARSLALIATLFVLAHSLYYSAALRIFTTFIFARSLFAALICSLYRSRPVARCSS